MSYITIKIKQTDYDSSEALRGRYKIPFTDIFREGVKSLSQKLEIESVQGGSVNAQRSSVTVKDTKSVGKINS